MFSYTDIKKEDATLIAGIGSSLLFTVIQAANSMTCGSNIIALLAIAGSATTAGLTAYEAHQQGKLIPTALNAYGWAAKNAATLFNSIAGTPTSATKLADVKIEGDLNPVSAKKLM